MSISATSAAPAKKRSEAPFVTSEKSVSKELAEALVQAGMTLSSCLGEYLLSCCTGVSLTAFPFEGKTQERFAGGLLETCVSVRAGEVKGSFFLTLTFHALEATHAPVSAGLHLALDRWSPENYVLMPGAVYAGNRFVVARSAAVEEYDNLCPNMPITITNVPRLEVGEGASRIQLLTGDFSTPAAGFRDARTKRGFFLLTNQGNAFGNHGISLEESEVRDAATLTLRSPGIREGVRYSGEKSNDHGVVLQAGEVISLELGLYFFSAPCIQSLFDYFFTIRNDFRGETTRRKEIPLSSCQEIQQAKYNAQNWVEESGYYSVGMRESAHQNWQTGWVGGTNAVYPLYCDGDGQTRVRSLRTFDFLRNGGVGASGYFRSLFHQGEWLDRHFTLTRYQADSLYFLIRTMLLHQKRNPALALSEERANLLKGCADALCRTWEQSGQLGQRVNTDTGGIVMGETACAGLAPGALALCSSFFHKPRYLQIAEAAAERYHTHFVRAGITNGGPGDILQCPDSESAFGLLEAFVTLYEVTGHRRYIEWARDTANQCATWVVSYDFHFPKDSTFGRMGMLTTGTVLANVQNKHSAPGICTLSGNSLLKLFRVTGDVRYLELIREIAHAIPQYMSRADRPICDRRPGQTWPVMDPGWVNERVNMSDWEVRGDPDHEIGVGEIFGGSTWSEVALMLTFAELPGIYVQPDTGLLAVFDHVDVRLERGVDGAVALSITNPTKFPAGVKLFAESSQDVRQPLGQLAMHDCPRIAVAPGATVLHAIQD